MKSWIHTAALLWGMVLLSSCEAIAAIFEAGVWVGVLLVLVILGVVFWVIGRTRRK